MKIKKEKIFWGLYACLLVLLYLLSSTDLLIKEQKSEVYPISVIIEDTKDDYYVNFKKGIDQAAMELNADVSFITLYEAGNREQQQDLILREQQDGAKALILVPVEERDILDMLAENQLNGPLVLYKSSLAADKINAAVSADYYAMGQRLAEAIQAEQPIEVPVYLFGPRELDAVSRQIYDGLYTELEEAGYRTVLFQKKDADVFRRAIEELVYPGSGNVTIAALDQESLIETAEILAESSVYASCVGGLYGRGATVPVLNYLDRGMISGICITDEFGAGYLSVRQAVDAIKNHGIQERVILDFHYIRKEDIRKPEYEKMLYPIE